MRHGRQADANQEGRQEGRQGLLMWPAGYPMSVVKRARQESLDEAEWLHDAMVKALEEENEDWARVVREAALKRQAAHRDEMRRLVEEAKGWNG